MKREDSTALTSIAIAHKMILAQIISLLTNETSESALHVSLIQRMGEALDAEDMALAVEIQNQIDEVFLISRAFRKPRSL